MNKKYLLFLTLILISISFFALANKAQASATLQKVRANNLGLVGYWSMNGADVTDKVYDRSGQNNNAGFYGGATSTAKTIGKIGQALNFNGSSNYIDVGSDLVGSGDRTTCAWAYLASPMGNNTLQSIFDSITYQLQYFYISSTYYILLTSNGSNTVLPSLSSSPVGVWNHICAVRPGGAGVNASIYLNGTFLSTGNDGNPSSVSTLQIGAGVGNYYFNGKIDEARVYSRLLSASEIKQLYNMGAAKVNSSQNSRLTNGLVGMWSMDGADVTDKVYDRSGQNNNGGFYGGATSTAKIIGKLGQALSFDGVDDYVRVNANPIGTGAFTASAWVYLRSGTTKTLFSLETAGGVTVMECTILFSGVLACDNESPNSSYAATTDALPLNQWVFVTIVRQSSGTAMTLYFNGIRNGAADQTVDPSPSSSGTVFYIGALDDGPSQVWNGFIDEARVYNRVLSATEIQQLYNMGAAKVNSSQNTRLTNGLVGLWSFNGADVNWTSATAGTALDRSGQNNTGTLTNMNRSTSPVIGKVGQALKFTGSPQLATVNASASLEPVQMSISFWFKAVDTGNVYRLIDKATSAYVVRQNLTPAMQLVTTEGCDTFFDSSTSITPNVWQHWVFTAGSGGCKWYFNGTLDSQTATAFTGSGSAGSDLTFSSITDPLKGSIDEVRVYNRVLTADEIKQLYNMGR